MARQIIQCPRCKNEIEIFRNPIPTVDIIIEYGEKGIVLIKRKNPPFGWAIPGGFVDYGESLEEAAVREAKEETNLDVELVSQFHTYSDPNRDIRYHTITTAYIAKGNGTPEARDDASEIGVFTRNTLPEEIAFDHRQILEDYFCQKQRVPIIKSG
jgi:ADP-ribose pyrophosphatase YjhB (NUDIX family)